MASNIYIDLRISKKNMLLIPAISKCFAVAFPAIMGSTITTPMLAIADDAIVNSAKTGNMMGSIVSCTRDYKIDMKSGTTFATSFATLLSANCFVDENLKTFSGVFVNTALSAWKDDVFMGGNLSVTTRSLFILKDILSTIPAIAYPDMSHFQRLVLVFLSQIPCTLMNMLAIDLHVFKKTKRGRRTRVIHSSLKNFPIRFLKSTLGGALAFQINFGIIKHI